ncbi:hypothetical protein KC19_VG325800 [Ceratodon purpureus]|uniref:K+ potassium transporter integral membrane domain-containing protein n=1 Tax=Ceratodon purpureus TaxID=3225 RepID=A0A8T0HWZ7_CERPU|nr:hypothetical protein KC19_VG325800 [Ceratodon purpureus]
MEPVEGVANADMPQTFDGDPGEGQVTTVENHVDRSGNIDRSGLSDGRLWPVMQYTDKVSIAVLLTLAYQSFGVVYGDLSVSPLYVFRSTFGGALRNSVEEYEIEAVLCFIFWTLTLIPVIKYGFIILGAHDNGEGGTFALYALLCRHLKLSLILNQQAADEELSSYKLDHPSTESPRGVWFRRLLEKHKFL